MDKRNDNSPRFFFLRTERTAHRHDRSFSGLPPELMTKAPCTNLLSDEIDAARLQKQLRRVSNCDYVNH